MRKIRIHTQPRYITTMNEETGAFTRSGLLSWLWLPTGKEVHRAPYPELLDIGIMDGCEHGLSGLCRNTQCYQNGSTRRGTDMPLEEYKRLLQQFKGKTLQVALGGCGDVDMHRDYAEILRLSREAHVPPNFTTSGLGMTREKAEIAARYCGCTAVSWYRQKHTFAALKMLLEAGSRTYVHYLLSNETIDEAIWILRKDFLPPGLTAIVFLLHKPVGEGTQDRTLRNDDPRLQVLTLLTEMPHPFAIGFDSCSVPMLVNRSMHLDRTVVDTCEGARFSAYITPQSTMVPCSFDRDLRWGVDLHTHTIKEAWDSPTFLDFSDRLKNACPTCPKRDVCMGGCPVRPEIVLCGSDRRAVP
jgi:radical SAM protein with 4Fe4S-binding SPASM domain